MKCPKCGSPKTTVYDTRGNEQDWRDRRRRCQDCGHKFATVEIPSDELRRLRGKANTPFTSKAALRGVIEQLQDILKS